MPHLNTRLGAAFVACAALLAACDTMPTATRDVAAPSLTLGTPTATTVTVTTGTVTRVWVGFGSGSLNKTNWTIPVGGSEQFTAIAYDSAGRTIVGRKVVFRSSNATSFRVDSTTGLGVGLAALGTVNVSATVDGVTTKSANFSIFGVTSTSATVKTVSLAYTGGAIDTSSSTWTITAGGTAQFKATALDSLGVAVPGVTPVYRSSNAAALKVDSTTGTATAVAAGTATITAVMSGVTGTFRTITVAPQAPPPPPPPPPPAGSIVTSIRRFDGLNGAATVSTGVPLAPGALRPGQDSLVRVYVGGVEQAAYVTGLTGVHNDGSLRAVLVQFKVASLASATPLAGQIAIGSVRPAAMRIAAPLFTPGTLVTGAPAGLPQAAVLPTDPNYLVTTDLAGGTLTAAATAPLGTVFARYDTDFKTHADVLWAAEGAAWAAANYYDRALIYYAMWARTGDPTYWSRAGQLAYDYRTKYLEPNNYGASPHWMLIEGLEKHFLMTGDEKSRISVIKTANAVYNGYINSGYMTSRQGESRIAARVLHGALLGWRMSPPGSPAVPGLPTTPDWGSRVETALDKIEVWQAADGSWPAPGQVCGGQLNYMVGLLDDAMIKTSDYYLPAATSRAAIQGRIKTMITKAAGYLWNTQWVAASKSFQYASVLCTGIGGLNPSPDLNNLIVTTYGWLYRQTGDVTYRNEAEQIFAGGVTQAFVSGTKQFNEEYTASFRYLAYR